RYEKESARTLVVFFALEGASVISSWSCAIALTFGCSYSTSYHRSMCNSEMINKRMLLCVFAASASIGVSVIVLVANCRASANLRYRVSASGYCVARVYQIRENMRVIKALARIGARVMLLNACVFALAFYHHFPYSVIAPEKIMISRAVSDLIISLYPLVIITYVPLSDALFEKSLKQMPCGHSCFKL
ncbi:hypothetical protein PMAYCL1PPCAC_15066, partial [Pristionchus mayeri]